VAIGGKIGMESAGKIKIRRNKAKSAAPTSVAKEKFDSGKLPVMIKAVQQGGKKGGAIEEEGETFVGDGDDERLEVSPKGQSVYVIRQHCRGQARSLRNGKGGGKTSKKKEWKGKKPLIWTSEKQVKIKAGRREEWETVF